LKAQSARDFSRLDERIRRANAVLAQQEAEAKGQKYQAAVSFGATLLGSFLGRRTTTGATRTVRAVGRSMKESRDREGAESNLQILQQERTNLETQFQSEVNALETKTDPLTENLENVSINPTKTNITVRPVALVWTL